MHYQACAVSSKVPALIEYLQMRVFNLLYTPPNNLHIQSLLPVPNNPGSSFLLRRAHVALLQRQPAQVRTVILCKVSLNEADAMTRSSGTSGSAPDLSQAPGGSGVSPPLTEVWTNPVHEPGSNRWGEMRMWSQVTVTVNIIVKVHDSFPQ